jgi:hypothetical protein
MRPHFAVMLAALACAAMVPRAASQDRGAAASTAKASAAVDLTGYWVAFVTEDWLPHGDAPQGRLPRCSAH